MHCQLFKGEHSRQTADGGVLKIASGVAKSTRKHTNIKRDRVIKKNVVNKFYFNRV